MRYQSQFVGGLLLNVGFSLLLGHSVFAQDKRETPNEINETVSFFESDIVSELKLVIDEESQQHLRDAPREYIRGSLVKGGATTYKSIGIKLKGAAGSFSEFDDRPGLTLKLDKYKKGQRFHGMEKFHLNNAVQDETFASEWLGSEIFRAAGIPATRVGHVRLWINDRDMGVYVIREGFDVPYLKRSFQSQKGNLYDGGFIQDIDSELEMDQGDDPDQRDDLKSLAIACYHPIPATRRALIEEQLDIEQFLTFMAVERLCGHWDGYTLNINNYRVFFPAKGKGVFLPHGMDQLFGDPGAGLYDHSSPMLAAAVMQSDEWRTRYHERLKSLAVLLQPADSLLKKIDALHARLQPVFESIDPNLAQAHSDRINELKDRIRQRAEALPELIHNGMPSPIEFDSSNVVRLTDWYPSIEAEDVKAEEVDVDGLATYSITRERFGDFSSSWRTTLLLPKGKYRFQARIKTQDVIPIPDDQGRGAGIRRSASGRSNELLGSSDWTLVTYEIDVPEDQRQMELVLELRARYGRAWFDRESLKIERIQE